MLPTTTRLLLCGPQDTSLSERDLHKAYVGLTRHASTLASLASTVEHLPILLSQLLKLDSTLGVDLSTLSYMPLNQWLVSGELSQPLEKLPNRISLPITVIFQIAQYLQFLDSKDTSSHDYRPMITELAEYGAQGFCVGFLSAIIIALSSNEQELSKNLGTSVKLAACIGLYIDSDSASVATAVLSARWKAGQFSLPSLQSVLTSYGNAYVSCVTDDTCATVTILKKDRSSMISAITATGARVKEVNISGRFHSAVIHSRAARLLMEFAATTPELAFPSTLDLKLPLRSTATGDCIKVESESITEVAIECILLRTTDWYGTLRKTLPSNPSLQPTVTSLAARDSLIPLSLAHGSTNGTLEGDHAEKPKVVEEKGGIHLDKAVIDRFSEKYPQGSIAVIGMAGRFPGANDVSELWELLASGVSMVREAPLDRLPLHGQRLSERSKTTFWGNFIDDPESFDHRFFKKTSREAVSWDPEKRILLEVVYQALEAAGYWGPLGQVGSNDFGVYLGVVANNYYDNVACHPPNAYSMLGTSRAFYSGRIAHQFGLTGPAMSVDTACSSSMVAIHQACKAIQAGECTRAIAGGTNVFTSPYDYQNLAAAGFLSPSGGCKPFDTSADGYCRGEGVAAVILKSLDQAIAEGDQVLGVILGSSVNQNHNDAHITVPCASQQTTAYEKVLGQACITPSDVTYVEAHGTGTQIGDPIEVQSIRKAFGGTYRQNKLFLASVKGHIGHTEASAGVTGLIKVLLQLQHKSILGQVGFSHLNPKIPALAPDMMEIPTKTQPWSAPRRVAFVNSYGAAGSNAAIAIEESRSVRSTHPRPRALAVSKQPFYLSAASKGSLSAYAQSLLSRLDSLKVSSSEPELLIDVLFHLCDRGNHNLAHAISETITNFESLEQLLRDIASGTESSYDQEAATTRSTILVFGGQERRFVGLAQNIIDSSTLLRTHLDACDAEARVHGITDLYTIITSTDPVDDLAKLHAALFSSQYATARAWIDAGLSVQSLLGHSFGQLTALCVSGVLSLQDAFKVVVERALLIRNSWGRDSGAMLSIQADRATVESLISKVPTKDYDESLGIACFNHPANHVVVGASSAIDELEKAMQWQPPIKGKRLDVTNGFHSVLTEPLLPSLQRLAEQVQWRAPAIHVELTTESSTSASFGPWIIPQHMRESVFFSSAVRRLGDKHTSGLWVEAGAGSSVLSLVKQTLSDKNNHVLAPSFLNTSNSVTSLAETVVAIWKAGISVQHWPFHRCQRSEYMQIDLPPYQFEKTKHWLPFVEQVGPKPTEEAEATAVPGPIVHEFLSLLEEDTAKKESLFLVDPESERYTYLLNGHIANKQALAPASIYVELLSLATLRLVRGADYTSHVTSMENVKFVGAPIGLDATRNIFIRLRANKIRRNYWDFEFVSSPKTVGDNTQTHTIGTVGLERRDDPELRDTFTRWGALIDYSRCLSLTRDETAESMSGKHIYLALQRLIYFDEMYHGIKSIAYKGRQAAGKVAATLDPSLDAKDALYDAPTLDGMMQFAGVLVNYFAHPSNKEVLLCQGIQRVATSGSFDITAGEWLAYSLLTEDHDERTVADVYIFDKESKQVVIAFLGFIFTRTSVSVLQRSLRSANSGGSSTKATAPAEILPEPVPIVSAQATSDTTTGPASIESKPSRKPQVYEIISRVTDVPIEELADGASLEDLGIDSLLVTEVLNEIRDAFQLEIDLDEFLFFPSLGHVCRYIDTALGASEDVKPTADLKAANDINSVPKKQTDLVSSGATTSRPPLVQARRVFSESISAYSDSIIGTGAAGFWSDVYPDQAALVLAYVVEAFARLGCDTSSLDVGAEAPSILDKTAQRHVKVVAQYYRVLEDGGYLVATDGKYLRTNRPVSPTPAHELYEQILPKWPLHANVHKVVQAVGSELADCLTGKADGLQIVFGKPENKKALDDLYEHWPLVRSGSVALGTYLERVLKKPATSGKYRILEVGAGTGGTARYIVRHLQQLGVPFEYVFTDLSPSLVSRAKRTFKDYPQVEYATLDIEKEPPADWVDSFHVIISTNCIHATRDLKVSLSNLRKLLRPDGVLTLVEITQNMFWLDIAVGLFEGWWLMADGRTHAVTHQDRWKSDMLTAGFADAAWTDGEDKEAQTIRIVAGFASE